MERSIEERPDRTESYLKLARGYEESGKAEKAAEVYRWARERFLDDEDVRQESESYRERHERSTERDEYEAGKGDR